MKPIVGAFGAWSCIVLSLFGIVLLSTVGGLFKSGYPPLMDSTDDSPENGDVAAHSCFIAVFIYIGFLVFCGCQAFLHQRNSRGAISLS